MSPISPVPTTRVTSQYVTRRLLSQIQFDQRELFRVQTQLSTGLRIQLPSEDAPAALRAINLQQLTERKEQIQANLQTGQSFLGATDSALQDVSAMLADIRGEGLSVLDTISDDTARQAVAAQVRETIQELIRIGNQQFRGRYLFAGSQTAVCPFEMTDSYVKYVGNENHLKSFSDLDRLFETSVNGNDAFGAISESVRGSVDLNPVLSDTTLLRDLRGGLGISQGSISVSDGINVSRVDLSRAVTIGDVARQLELQPPPSRTITATVTSAGLTVQLDEAGGGNLTITEVGGGTTAHELGIFDAVGVLTGQLVGDDLNPRLRPTTALANILGAPASASIPPSGITLDKTSGIRVTNGDQTYEISFATAETVEDVLNILNGSAAGLLAEINPEGTGIDVRSRLSGSDFSIGENGGETATQLGLRTLTASTTLASLNRHTGVHTIDGTDFTIVRNDGVQLEIDVSSAVTIGDILDLINQHPDNQDAGAVVARLAEYGNGIELVDDNPTGVGPGGQPNTLHVLRDFTSLAAIHLGLMPAGDGVVGSVTSPAMRPTGVAQLTNPNSDLTVTAALAGTRLGGTRIELVHNVAAGDQALVTYDAGTGTLRIDVDPASTRANTVVDAVNAEGTFLATLNTDRGPNDGTGLVIDTGEVAVLSAGSPEILTGADVHPQETAGAFNTLIRLRIALEHNDLPEIERAITMLEEDINRVTFVNAEIGARQQSLDNVADRLQEETVELKQALSVEINVDLAEAISNLAARQFALEASLQASARTLQLTLLDFL